MSDRRDMIYIYDGTFDGFLCVVFESFYRRKLPVDVAVEGEPFQQCLECDVVYVDTDPEKARRVYDSIELKISRGALRNVFYVFLSDCPDKERLLTQYLYLGYRLGKNVDCYLTLDAVTRTNEIAKRVSNEASHYLEFIRFSELTNGALYAEISPKCSVLPIIVNHFCDRFASIPWLIHDLHHHTCAMWNLQTCEIRQITAPPKLEYSPDEQKYRTLWRLFYDTVEIKERHNDKLRTSNMPKRYWGCLTEFQRKAG